MDGGPVTGAAHGDAVVVLVAMPALQALGQLQQLAGGLRNGDVVLVEILLVVGDVVQLIAHGQRPLMAGTDRVAGDAVPGKRAGNARIEISEVEVGIVMYSSSGSI